MVKGKIHSFETFGSVDGPGVRFLVFLSGCNFRCKYCHNPDTWARPAALEMSADEVLAKALRYKAYWGADGGITVSGGEPLLQLEFLTEFFEKAREKGVHTCIDTAAGPFTREEPWFGKFRKLMDVTDLLLLDLKHIDPAAHRELTGADNANVLDCAKFLSEIGKPVWIRHVLVPGVNTDEPSLTKLGAFIRTLTNVKKVEVLPYHALGVPKWRALNLPYVLEGVNPPTADQLALARSFCSPDCVRPDAGESAAFKGKKGIPGAGINCRFADPPPPGKYDLTVRCRNGADPSFAPAETTLRGIVVKGE